MFRQREVDIALVEAKVKVQKEFEKWMKDYLGSRADGRGERSGQGSRQTAEVQNRGAGQPVPY